MPYQDLSCTFETKDEKSDSAMFSGVASTTDLDGNREVIEAGAFEPIPYKLTGEPDILMLRDHDVRQVIGGWTRFAQIGTELHVEGQLCLAVEKARETYALMKARYLTGLSVGYIPDRSSIRYDDRSNRRIVRKASLKECSIVARPANDRARVLSVKGEFGEMLARCGLSDSDVDILVNEGLEALLERRDAQKPWGDVTYADPGYQDDKVRRYPIHTESNIRAAWSYINMPKNQRAYTSEQIARIKARIIAAWKDKIDKDGPPSAKADLDDDYLPSFLETPMDELRVAHEARALLSQLKGRCHG